MQLLDAARQDAIDEGLTVLNGERSVLLLQIINSVLSSQSLDEVIACTLNGVRTLGFERVRFYCPIEDGRYLTCTGFIGMPQEFTRKLWEVTPQLSSLLEAQDQSPRLILESEAALVGVREPVDGANPEEPWLWMPLVSNDEIVGLITADNGINRPTIPPANITSLGLLALQAGHTLRTTRLLDDTRRRVKQLEALRHTTMAIIEENDRDDLLGTLIQEAIKLLKAKNGGFYRFLPTRSELVVVCDFQRPDHLGVTLKIGEGMAGQLFVSGEPFMIVKNYAEWEHRAAVFNNKPPYGAVLEVPLKWNNETIGIVYVDDDVGREFTPDDARLLSLFADQAAILLVNAELVARDGAKMESLMKLSKATKEIMSDLEGRPLDQRLTLIARHVTEILDAEVCYIPLVNAHGLLSLEASFGHRKGSFQKGKEFKIRSGPKLGLLGHIAYEGQPFNMSGEALRAHPAVAGEPPQHLESGICHSLLSVPLKKTIDGNERLLGLLCADNKKSPDPSLEPKFSLMDEWMLQVFGEAVVIALESADLVSQLIEQKDRLQRLVSSSPAGIIAVDCNGNVTLFNERAEEILGYTREEVLDTPVALYYSDPHEPRRIGRLLHESADGRVIDYETQIKDKAGETISIKHSSTWLVDSTGKRSGSVGYFEDLRAMELLLKSSSIVAQARDLSAGLNRLVELTSLFLPHTFCRILVIDEGTDSLRVEAAFHSERNSGAETLDHAEVVSFAEWPSLNTYLEKGQSRLLHLADDHERPFLEKVTAQMALDQTIQALLLIPLRSGDVTLGLIEFGRLESEFPFAKLEISLAEALAEKATTLIDRMRLHDLTERRGQLLKTLVDASLHIRAEKDTDKLLQKIVRLATELVGCTSGGLYIHEPLLNTLDLKATHGLLPDWDEANEALLADTVRAAADKGEPQVRTDYHLRRKCLNAPYHKELWTLATAPLMNKAGELEAVLFVGSYKDRRPLSPSDLEVIVGFAAQASIALEISRLLTQEQRIFNKLTTLNRISDYGQATKDMDKMLHALLTGVTSNFGLQFNRAALLLREPDTDMFYGRMGIGYLDEQESRKAWERESVQAGISNFAQYLEMLERDELSRTPLEHELKKLRFRLGSSPASIFYESVRKRLPIRVKLGDPFSIPEEFLNIFQPASPLVVVPLVVHEAVIGLLIADNKITRAPVTDDDVKLLVAFANTAAITIDNARLLEQNRLGREKLSALFEASDALISSRDPRLVLQDIVEQPPLAADAAWARIILIDEMGNPWDQIFGGGQVIDDSETIRADGISMHVMRSGKVEKIENTHDQRHRVNPFILKHGIGAALCFPFSLRGNPIGVMWINYSEPRLFPDYEISALQLYVNHAALAYENAYRVKRLERLNQSAHTIARAFKPGSDEVSAVEQILNTVVEEASLTMRADSSTIWSYDDAREKFIPDELHAHGISKESLNDFRDLEPWPRGTTYKVLHEGWIAVNDTQLREYSFLRPEMRLHLEHSGVRSFQGIALKVGNETVAVLYVGYKKPRTFSVDDRRALESFATYAALSLKNARLLDQVSTAKKGAQVVAAVTALGDYDRILQSIADGTISAVGASAVVLYTYDSRRDRWRYPPTHAGVWHPERAWPNDVVPPTSIVNRIRHMKAPYIAERAADDELLRGRFSIEEQIETSIALPLEASGAIVGVMFVNYRQRTRFRDDELSNITLFANQAAIAIHNAQLFESRARQLKEQQELVKMSEEFLRATSEEEILASAVATAAKLLEAEYCNIVLPDRHGQLVFRAGFGWAKEMIGNFPLANGKGSQTGYTISTRRPVAVQDYRNRAARNFDVPPIVEELNIMSGLSVPMFRGQNVIGSMLVHTLTPKTFDKEDIQLFELIANQTAIALQNLERYQGLAKQSAYLNALYKGSAKVVPFGAERKQVLQQILHLAVEGLTSIEGQKAFLGTIQLYNEATKELVLESVYPPEEHPNLVKRIKERRSLDPSMCDGKVGVTGLTVLRGRPIRVPNVKEKKINQIYVPFDQRTQSELTVPLYYQSKVIGVLNVESDKLGAFDEDDLSALKALSDMAVVAIMNAEQFAELKRTKGLVGARTALAWMGMASSNWRHVGAQKASTIRNGVFNIRQLAASEKFRLPPEIDSKLLAIEQSAIEIMSDRPAPSLSADEVTNVHLNELVSERLDTLWDGEHRYTAVSLERKLGTERFFAKVNAEWLQTAFDNLIDNAYYAVEHLPEERRIISVELRRRAGGGVELVVADTGKGIPPEILAQTFNKQIEKSKDDDEERTGLGMGLLMAQAIVETYGGTLNVGSTGAEGTEMVIWLP